MHAPVTRCAGELLARNAFPIFDKLQNMVEIADLSGVIAISDRRLYLPQHFILGSRTVHEHRHFGAFQKNGERRH